MNNPEQPFSESDLPSREVLQAPTMDYDSYRELCDANAGSFRLLGVIEPDAYDAAINDDHTGWIIHGSKRAPYLVRIEDAPGYDAERSRQLTDRPNTFLMSLPLNVVEKAEEATAIPEDAAVIIESPSGNDLSDFASKHNLQVKDFIDQTIDSPEHQPASIRAFGAHLMPAPEYSKKPPAPNLYEAWQDYLQERSAGGKPVDIANEALYFRPEDLKANPQLLESLWEICESRFGELGEFHPVSMEESKDFLFDMLLNEDTHTVVKFDEGEPACFGFFMLDLNQCSWLSDSFKKEQVANTDPDKERILYYPEIMRKRGTEVQALSVIALQSQLLAKLRKGFNLIFEATNRSATYIPYVVEKYVAGTGALLLSDHIKEVERLDYKYLVKPE